MLTFDEIDTRCTNVISSDSMMFNPIMGAYESFAGVVGIGSL